MSRRKDNSMAKIVLAAVAVAVIAFGAYKIVNKSSDKAETADAANPAAANEVVPSGLNPKDSVDNVADVEKVVAKWVEANPKAIINSVVNMQSKMMQEQSKNAQKNIGTKKEELFNNANDGQYAPSGYDVTVVEFFDYNCGYCKKAQTTVEELVKADGKVRIVYKEFPILGQASHDLSQVAVAVNQVDPSSYKKFHDALMKSNEKSKAGALKVAKAAGINVSKVEAYLKSNKSKIEKIIQDNLALGSSIGVTGTPGFVIGEELIPGALDFDSFKSKVDALRNGAAAAPKAE